MIPNGFILEKIADSFVLDSENHLGLTSLYCEETKLKFNEIKTILIIQFSAFGDCIITASLAESLSKTHSVSILTFKEYEKIFSKLPRIFALDTDVIKTGDKKLIIQLFQKTINLLNTLNFDLVINLHPSEYSAFLSSLIKSNFFAGQKYSVTENKIFSFFSLSSYLKYFPSYFKQIIPEKNFFNQTPLLFFYEKSLLHNIQLEQTPDVSKKKQIVITPGGVWNSKRWSIKNFAELINLISHSYPDFKICITGSKQESDLISEIISLTNPNINIELFCGVLDYNGLYNLIAESFLLISNDTAPLHIADKCGTLSLLLLFSTSTIPYSNSIIILGDSECHACLKENCSKDFPCFEKLNAAEVFKAAGSILQNYQKTFLNIIESLKNINFENDIYYTLSDSKLKIPYPLNKSYNDTQTEYIVLYLISITVLSNLYENSEFNFNVVKNSLKIFFKNRSNISNKTFYNLAAKLGDIIEPLKKMLKSVIRMNTQNFNETLLIINKTEILLSENNLYHYLLKPYNILLYDSSEKKNYRNLKKIIDTYKKIIKIKHNVLFDIISILKKFGEADDFF